MSTQSKNIELGELIDLVWKMTTDYHKDYEPGELICPGTYAELADIINHPITIITLDTVDGMRVYRIALDKSQTRDQSEREIRYSILPADRTHSTLYFLHT